MHDGSLASLRDVAKHHYSELPEGEIDDLVAFLESLSPLPDK